MQQVALASFSRNLVCKSLVLLLANAITRTEEELETKFREILVIPRRTSGN